MGVRGLQGFRECRINLCLCSCAKWPAHWPPTELRGPMTIYLILLVLSNLVRGPLCFPMVTNPNLWTQPGFEFGVDHKMGFRHTAAWAPKIIRNFACKESRNQCCTKVMPNGIPSLASRVSCPVMAGKDIVCWKRTVKKNAMWVSSSRTSKWIVQ